MKKLSQILENKDDGTWEVRVELSLFINAANEGEAAFLAEDVLDKIELEKEMNITDISKKSNIEK